MLGCNIFVLKEKILIHIKMKTIKSFFSKYHLWMMLFIFLFLSLVTGAVAQEAEKPVKVKIVKVVDGDTTIIEKSMEQTNVEDFTNQFQNIKGKNVQVMITVKDAKKDEKNETSLSTMHFNFDTDSSMENLFAKAFAFSDSAFAMNFNWKDSLSKHFSKNFDFNLDEEVEMNDFDFDIHTDDGGKKVIIKNGKGKTVVINGDEDNVTLNESQLGRDENGTTKTKTKTIVIKDEKKKNKKKIIVSTSVTVVDMDKDDERGSGSEGRAEKKEINFSFYPNPSDGNFILELNLDGKEEAKVLISDINGKEVYNERINASGKISKAINLGTNKNGTFIVTIKQGKRTISKKIIIE